MPFLTKKESKLLFLFINGIFFLYYNTSVHSIKQHDLPPSPLHTFLIHCRGVFAYHKTMTMRMKRNTTLQYKYSKLLCLTSSIISPHTHTEEINELIM